MKGLSLGEGGPDMVLRAADDALSVVVVGQGHSRADLALHLERNVHLCLSDGTWHASSAALEEYVRTSGTAVNREVAKKFRFARLLLVGGHARVRLPQNHIRLSNTYAAAHHPERHFQAQLTACRVLSGSEEGESKGAEGNKQEKALGELVYPLPCQQLPTTLLKTHRGLV